MRATFQPAGGAAGCSHANGEDARRWPGWPPPLVTPTINTAVTAATATMLTLTGVRRIGSDAAVAVARTAVVVGVLVTAVVLGNPIARRLGSGLRRRLGSGLRRRLGSGPRRRRLGCRLGRASCPGRLRRVAGDLGAGRGHHEPCAAERHQALTVRVAAGLVALEAIERVAVVGHLRLPVRPLRGTDLRGLRAGAGRRLAAHSDRRPGLGARTVARALGPLVLPEEVDGAAMRVDEDPAEAAVCDADGRHAACGLAGGGRRRRGRRGRARSAAAPTTAGDDHRRERQYGRAGEEVARSDERHARSFHRGPRSVTAGTALVVGRKGTLCATTPAVQRLAACPSCGTAHSGAQP